MKKLMKRIVAAGMAAMLLMGGTMTAYATQYAEWNASNMRYSEGWLINETDNTWEYIGNGGMLLLNATTPDGCQVNERGQWVVDGVVQKAKEKEIIQIDYAAYDPAHPLANVVDAWDLKLPYQSIGPDYVCGSNIQAMLTNQMEQYYMPPVGDSVDPRTGAQMHVAQEDYDATVYNTQALYNWFCNWLNGMDFQHMSEMDKAKEIQKVLAQGINITGENSNSRNADYSVLIDKQGMCAEYAMTAISLAKAMGLKSAVGGTGSHAVYYIQVDGVAYFGQNNVLNLNSPTPDFVYFQ